MATLVGIHGPRSRSHSTPMKVPGTAKSDNIGLINSFDHQKNAPQHAKRASRSRGSGDSGRGRATGGGSLNLGRAKSPRSRRKPTPEFPQIERDDRAILAARAGQAPARPTHLPPKTESVRSFRPTLAMAKPSPPNLDDRPERASERAQGDLQIKIAALDFWGSERGFWFQVGGWRVFVLPGFRARGLSGDGALLLLVLGSFAPSQVAFLYRLVPRMGGYVHRPVTAPATRRRRKEGSTHATKATRWHIVHVCSRMDG